MSNAIGFLETVGADATLRLATQNTMELALANAQIEPAVQAAILGGDQQQLEVALAAPIIVCCGLDPGKEEEEEPARDDDEIVAHSVVCGIASAA